MEMPKPILQLLHLFYGIMQIMLMYLVIQVLKKVFGIGTVLTTLLKITVYCRVKLLSAESASGFYPFGNITTQASIGSGDDFIPGDDLNYIQSLRKTFGNSTEIYFNEFGSDELNKVTTHDPSLLLLIYSRLVENDLTNLSFDEMWDKTIPIGINAQSLTISISYRTTPADLKVYLEDTELNTLTNLVEEDYVLIPQMDIQGVGRYFIHTSAETMSSEEVSTSLLNVYNEVNTNFITIEGLATQSSNTTVSLYNIL